VAAFPLDPHEFLPIKRLPEVVVGDVELNRPIKIETLYRMVADAEARGDRELWVS